MGQLDLAIVAPERGIALLSPEMRGLRTAVAFAASTPLVEKVRPNI